jgi:hypothetical protein
MRSASLRGAALFIISGRKNDALNCDAYHNSALTAKLYSYIKSCTYLAEFPLAGM